MTISGKVKKINPALSNESYCPAFTTGTISSATIVDSSGGYAVISCNYPDSAISSLMTLGDIETWSDAFIYGSNSADKVGATQTLNEQILPTYCTGVATECPVDPASGSVPDTCSRFLDLESSVCPIWAYTYPALADSSKTIYCLRTPNASECSCILRNDNPVYQTLGEGIPDGQAHCWFIPCSNPSYYLELSTFEEEPCPDVCGVVVRNFDSQTDISFEDAKFYVNCEGFNTGGGSPVPTGASNNPEGPGLPLWLNILLIIGLVVLVILVLSMIIVVIVKKKRGEM